MVPLSCKRPSSLFELQPKFARPIQLSTIQKCEKQLPKYCSSPCIPQARPRKTDSHLRSSHMAAFINEKSHNKHHYSTILTIGTRGCRFLKSSKWYFPKIRGPQYRPQNTIILNIGTPKKVPLIMGNPSNSLLATYNFGPRPLRKLPGRKRVQTRAMKCPFWLMLTP